MTERHAYPDAAHAHLRAWRDSYPLPASLGEPVLQGTMKQVPSDFRVDEELDIAFDGDGEHLFLQLRKTGLSTSEVLEGLRRHYGVAPADVGYSGLKDARAVTTQWFSVRTPAAAACPDGLVGVELLASHRHRRKLRIGAHKANRFVIRLRDVSLIAAREQVDAHLATLSDSGFPNYVGAQRFGRQGSNMARAIDAALLSTTGGRSGRSRKRVSRRQQGLWYSAARSALFNAVLAARVRAGNWCEPLEGEPLVLDGSRSHFIAETHGEDGERAALAMRIAAADVHCSGPLWGRGRSLASSACEAFESDVLSGFAALQGWLETEGVDQARRPLRAMARDLRWEWRDGGKDPHIMAGGECMGETLSKSVSEGDGMGEAGLQLELAFTLAPGSFATTLVGELTGHTLGV